MVERISHLEHILKELTPTLPVPNSLFFHSQNQDAFLAASTSSTTGADYFFFLFGNFLIPATRTLVAASVPAQSFRVSNAKLTAASEYDPSPKEGTWGHNIEHGSSLLIGNGMKLDIQTDIAKKAWLAKKTSITDGLWGHSEEHEAVSSCTFVRGSD
ncbi:hypothetical protein C8J57DRAFT_1229510 [Mycena rebaudengoi]|nr:hypothetical protein C8J57DRAFT_1229510 [Mycena rebaudengoi]